MSYINLVMRKPALCMCENKDANQLRSNCAADQHLCFRNIDSTIPLLSEFEISSLQSSSVTAQPGLFRTRLETPKPGFLTTRLILCYDHTCIKTLARTSNVITTSVTTMDFSLK